MKSTIINGIHRATIVDIKTGKKVTSPRYNNNSTSKKVLDIKARGCYPSNVLSNFSSTSFVLDGVKIKSMEGFLQSLKTTDINKQKSMCLLDGFEAKKMSKSLKPSENDMLMYWNGKTFTKSSEEYKNLRESVIEMAKKSKGMNFIFQGNEVASVASFITGLRVKEPEIQKRVLLLSQDNLKYVSKYTNPTYAIRELHWNGKTFKRDSNEYKELLNRAYKARYNADFKFREALRITKGYELVHTKGKSDINETVLTESEFIEQLNKLKECSSVKQRTQDFFLRIMYKVKSMLK